MPASSLETTEDSRSARPPNPHVERPRSHPSPRKIKTISRLSKPVIRPEDTNWNSTVNEYGERKCDILNIERYYSELIDEMGESGQVNVPTHMRRKMIHAIMETEKPHLYHAMTHLHKHYMTSSEARQARMQRQKAVMSKPCTLQELKPSYHQEMCYRDEIKAQEFTEKLIKVMLVLQNNEEHDYQLNLKSKEKEKASLRGVHIKVVVAAYFGSIAQRVTRTIVRRERKLYHEKVMYEKQVADGQRKVAKAWRMHRAYLEAKEEIRIILADRAAKIEKERKEEASFLRQMKSRMQKEQNEYASWQRSNTNVPLSSTRRSAAKDYAAYAAPLLCDPSQDHFLVPKSPEKSASVSRMMMMRPGSRAGSANSKSKSTPGTRSTPAPPHIEALMQKYGKPSIIDGYSRKMRVFDVQL